MTEGCFRQVEFAGILDGTEHEEAARRLVDFMLSEAFQEDIPLNMFVFPAVEDTALPDVFVEHAARVDAPLDAAPGGHRGQPGGVDPGVDGPDAVTVAPTLGRGWPSPPSRSPSSATSSSTRW